MQRIALNYIQIIEFIVIKLFKHNFIKNIGNSEHLYYQIQTHNTNSYINQPNDGYQPREQIIDVNREVSQGANLTNNKTQQLNNLNINELRDLFDEFKNKDTNQLVASEFVDHLQRANVEQSCKFLITKLRRLGDLPLTDQQFFKLFDFDFVSNEENLSIILEMFDKLGNNNQNISIQELQKMNNDYNLGLQQQDLQVMIKYGGNLSDSITLDQLKQLIMGGR